MDWDIMCVDDEKSSLVNLKYDLGNMMDEKNIIVFTNPLEALEYAKENKVDLAFLDVDMPELSGIDLAKELKKIQPDIKVVFISGDMKNRKESREIGIGFLAKPYLQSELEEILRKLEVSLD